MRDPQIPFSIQIDGQTFFRDDDTAWSEEDVGWLADCFHLRMEDSQRDDRARWDAAQARAERLVEFLMAMERLGVQVTELTFRTPPPPPPGPSVFRIGVSLVPFVINLIVMGWAVGIFTTAVILRFGQEAEVLAWGLAFLFQPVSAVFYPVSVLPPRPAGHRPRHSRGSRVRRNAGRDRGEGVSTVRARLGHEPERRLPRRDDPLLQLDVPDRKDEGTARSSRGVRGRRGSSRDGVQWMAQEPPS